MAGTGRKPYETGEVVPFGVEKRRLQPPDCLGELQRRAFLDLVCSVPVSQFRKCDLPLLCRWAELTVMAETAVFRLGAHGMVVDGKVSPWFSVYRDCTPRASRAVTAVADRASRPDAEGAQDQAERRELLRRDGATG